MPKYIDLGRMLLYMLVVGVFACTLLYAMTSKAGGEITTCGSFTSLSSAIQKVYVRSVISEKVTLQPMSVKACARSKTDAAHAMVLRTCSTEKNFNRAKTAAVKHVLMVCDFQPTEDAEWESWYSLELPFSDVEALAWD